MTKVMIFSSRRPSRPSQCGDRIGTKRTLNTSRDSRWDSSRPHLLTAKTHAGVTTAHAQKGIGRPTANRQAHPSRRSFSTTRRIRQILGSHLGSTLRPGRAVLTRGVSRRSGSVACVRADASPIEVLARTSWHRKQLSVKPN
jgi:hypothetical protein